LAQFVFYLRTSKRHLEFLEHKERKKGKAFAAFDLFEKTKKKVVFVLS
jgi:hypothetical protein